MSANTRRSDGMTFNPVSVGLVKGTTSTYTTTVASGHVINGKFGTSLGTQTNTATPTTDATTAAAFVAQGINTACCYVFGINAAGAIQVSQGPIVATLPGVTTTAGAFQEAPRFPDLPDDFCPIGYVLVRAAPSASAWTFGSSNWTATGITASTIQNVAVLPDRPQTA